MFKTKMLRGCGLCKDDRNLADYGVINLNVQMLQGLANNVPKLSGLLSKILKQEMQKIS